MSYQNILAERVEKVAIITLNRPEKLNALSYELACELDEELAKIENDDDVRVVILTGAGPRAFSAGGDIMQMVKSTPRRWPRAPISVAKRTGISRRLPNRSSAQSTAWPTVRAHS
jgi:enoyl-CoA hydratase